MNRGIAAAIFLTCMAVGIRRLCPDVFTDDSPETVTAAVTLGIAHPPGDPLLMLAGRLAAGLPVGSPAFRVNLLSTLFAASMAVAAWLLLLRHDGPPLARLGVAAAAISLLLSNPVLAQQSSIAKGGAYTLNLLLLLGVLAAALGRHPLPAALATGVLAGHHWMTAAAFTPVLLIASLRGHRRGPLIRTLAAMAVFLALGASVWACLPIRSVAHPALDWGGTSSAGRFLVHVTRKPFLGAELMPDPASVRLQLRAGAEAVLAQAGLPGLLLGVAGVAAGLATESAWAWIPAAAGAAGWLGAAVFLHLPRAMLRLLPAFLLPCWLMLFVVALQGARALATGRGYQRGLAVLLCLAAPVLQQAELARRAVDRFTWSPDLGRALLAPLPAGSGLFLVSDLDTFPVWDRQLVSGFRPDVRLVNSVLLGHDWYRRHLVDAGAPVALLAADTRDDAIRVLLRDDHRPWFSAAVPIPGIPPRFSRTPYHLTYQLTTGHPRRRPPRGYSYRGFFERLPRRPEPSAVMTTGYTMECIRNLAREGGH